MGCNGYPPGDSRNPTRLQKIAGQVLGIAGLLVFAVWLAFGTMLVMRDVRHALGVTDEQMEAAYMRHRR